MTMTNEKRYVACYTTDINFLLPSIFSAKSVRQFISKDKIDIQIILFHDSTDDYDFEGLSKVLAADRIFLKLTTPDFYKNVDTSIFQKGHVPIAAVGRFFLCDLLPEEYTHIVYLDGDTWVNQDPSELLLNTIPEGKAGFANDYASFEGQIRKGKFQHYWNMIGKSKDEGYFNSGVFASSRQTWKEISEEALKYLIENPKKCLYHDQSALNAIVKHRRVNLSIQWNFQTNFRFLHLEKDFTPIIFHFTRRPKAWEGAAFPWETQFHLISAVKKEFADFNLPIKSIDDARVAHINQKRNLQTSLFKLKFVRTIVRKLLGIDRYQQITQNPQGF